jgi:hypothetical protein
MTASIVLTLLVLLMLGLGIWTLLRSWQTADALALYEAICNTVPPNDRWRDKAIRELDRCGSDSPQKPARCAIIEPMNEEDAHASV